MKILNTMEQLWDEVLDGLSYLWQGILSLPWVEFFVCAVVVLFVSLLVRNMRQKQLAKNRGLSLVVGLEKVKKQLYQEVLFPFYHAQKYKKFHLSLPNGILLYGPTGCGKTFLVERLAEELNMNYIKLDHSELASPYIHETVGKIADVFKWAHDNAPCLVFIDEIESLVPARGQIGGNSAYKHEEVNEFLLCLNNAGQNGILVVGATNHLDLIDSAVMRSGRFDIKIHVPAPDISSRIALFQTEVLKLPHEKEINFLSLAGLTEGYSCSDICNIVKTAARMTVSQDLDKINQYLLEKAISETKSSLSDNEDNLFEKMIKKTWG